jgi:lipopolysaccharide/colanic/teichoic acid biosynthesis glycosyltransferase
MIDAFGGGSVASPDRRGTRRAHPRNDVPVVARQLLYAEGRAAAALRRAFDVVVAIVGLIVFAPILALACVAIFIEDGGPVIFSHQRVGQFEQLFTIRKLRTMRKNALGDALSPTSGRDPRISRVGSFLRKTSIDELPQLWNVLCGEMALVGPRPEMPFVVRRYESWQHLRHLVKPGITGLWQVTCRSTVPLHLPEATILDISYIQRSSTATDLMILIKTVDAVLRRRGAF